jgi:hypothetical protein
MTVEGATLNDMSIAVGQIPIIDDRRVVLPDLRDREVVKDLRESADRDVQDSNRRFWWFPSKPTDPASD